MAPTWKYVKVFEPNATVVEGVLLNNEHLKALADWLCDHTSRCVAIDEQRANQRKQNGGHCDSCCDDAGYMLTMCPYIDMNRAAEPELEAQPKAA
jgi:hypothetical protein